MVFKFLFGVSLCLFCNFVSFSSTIESIKNKEDARQFLENIWQPTTWYHNNYRDLFDTHASVTPSSYNSSLDDTTARKYFYWLSSKEYRSNNFYQLDIDGNGKIDLVVDASVLLVVMNMDTGYNVRFIEGTVLNTVSYIRQTVRLADSGAGLIFVREKYDYDKGAQVVQIDTVVYKYFGLVEQNRCTLCDSVIKISLSFHSVSSMSLRAIDNCCVEVSKSGQCLLSSSPLGRRADSISYLDKSRLSALFQFVAYSDLKSKDSSYIEMVNHSAGIAVDVYYNDGTKKHIETWNDIGSFGLESLSWFFYDLIETQNWQVTDLPMKCPRHLLIK